MVRVENFAISTSSFQNWHSTSELHPDIVFYGEKYRIRTYSSRRKQIYSLPQLSNFADFPYFMVRMVRFELTTYGIQNRRATRLRYTLIYNYFIS